ncbi:MAG: hypothetical protein L0Z54_03460 [Thermoplasmata archaeon]|nr:hypothetical protein [Thermoplasmata archaeon]
MGYFDGRRKATGRLIPLLATIICLAFVAGLATAQDKAVFGKVRQSDHDVATGHSGTYVAIIVTHNGTNYTYSDPTGLDASGWYSVTLPDGTRGDEWDTGDEFRVWVDGSDWGDGDWFAHNATGGGAAHDYWENVYVLNASISQRQDVEALESLEVAEFDQMLVVMVAMTMFAMVSMRLERARH